MRFRLSGGLAGISDGVRSVTVPSTGSVAVTVPSVDATVGTLTVSLVDGVGYTVQGSVSEVIVYTKPTAQDLAGVAGFIEPSDERLFWPEIDRQAIVDDPIARVLWLPILAILFGDGTGLHDSNGVIRSGKVRSVSTCPQGWDWLQRVRWRCVTVRMVPINVATVRLFGVFVIHFMDMFLLWCAVWVYRRRHGSFR